MAKKILLFIIAITTLVMISVQPVAAVQSPVGCNSNRLNLSLTRDKVTVENGDILTYTVSVSNVNALPNIACDIDTALVTLTLPALDGTPTGTVVTLATNAAYPAGTSLTLVGTTPYTVNVNPGVVDIIAEARVQGVLHDAPVDHAADITKTIGTAIVTPPTTPPTTPPSSDLPGLPNTSTAI